jgi:hypothetical protein
MVFGLGNRAETVYARRYFKRAAIIALLPINSWFLIYKRCPNSVYCLYLEDNNDVL